MGHINKDKTERAQLISTIWQSVRYQIGSTNCDTCNHDHEFGEDDKGTCKHLYKLPFPITRYGICRFHSSFKRDN